MRDENNASQDLLTHVFISLDPMVQINVILILLLHTTFITKNFIF
jgi:hypothetical protein